MAIDQEITFTKCVTTYVEEQMTCSLRVSNFNIRSSGPAKGELTGTTEVLNGEEVIEKFNWVVPAEEVMPVVLKTTDGKSSLYAAISSALYSFKQVVTRPAVRATNPSLDSRK